MTEEMIRVMIADDHPVVRQGLCAVLEAEGDIKVIGQATDGIEAVEKAMSLDPDVILMDLEMPRKNGISAISDIINRRPQTRVLVLSTFGDEAQVVESVRAGALGYLLKDAEPRLLIEAIHQVYAGESPMPPAVAKHLVGKWSPSKDEPQLVDILTRKELAVLRLVTRGLSNKEIAAEMGIAPPTVGTHMSNIFHKAGVDNRVQLSLLALKQGLSSLYTDDE